MISTGASPFFSAEIRPEIVAVPRSVVPDFAAEFIERGVVHKTVKRAVAAAKQHLAVGRNAAEYALVSLVLAENDEFELVVGEKRGKLGFDGSFVGFARKRVVKYGEFVHYRSSDEFFVLWRRGGEPPRVRREARAGECLGVYLSVLFVFPFGRLPRRAMRSSQ